MKMLFAAVLLIIFAASLQSWGFFAHRTINKHATYSLPADLAPFFKKHLYAITEKAINADKRVYIDSAESTRHFIDLDRYEQLSDSLVVPWFKLNKRLRQHEILMRGIVPWQIDLTYRKLLKAFHEKNAQAIIRQAADLGHYASDAHVPLHTTSNYNGQLSGQVGIHALWETRLPERFMHSYDLYVGKPVYIDNVVEFAWNAVHESHALLDSVFDLEKKVSASMSHRMKKSYVLRNNILMLNYSDEFCERYHEALNGMVERRIRKAIHATASLWYSAWIDAGQPDLSELAPFEINKKDSIPYQRLSPKGREEWH
ncbi:zinc dependent phospholipase C family protein [Sphingobacterium hotanense]|uniref:zinc dependent phospholipase C family protein n=1 Tax=Sphingobacterium hotanense TaxID=649196 RepID=UPI0011F216B7|nr:zinc dependent phospholipase C family protein [Sphingobacterium hotanense]